MDTIVKSALDEMASLVASYADTTKHVACYVIREDGTVDLACHVRRVGRQSELHARRTSSMGFPIVSKNGLRTYMALCIPLLADVVIVLGVGNDFKVLPFFDDGKTFDETYPGAFYLRAPTVGERAFFSRYPVQPIPKNPFDVTWNLLM
jgi:hypothetical protein